ncbi:hypothetical protein [Parabacteroides chinchillae]|uniref:Uncharacterized protein n=1 Tax=Parabacteroides chinchillae TaxID=871327 RepID=A0A8G2BX82_9BACT|nr:hypothetical protein [Parabacteroides chinchillae]SEG01010.1 hypothetical protein SAMN05444001_11215 [Parabacteroides chinchillae]
MKKLPTIALGTWSWGTGAAGGDQVFGNHLEAEDLKPTIKYCPNLMFYFMP